MNICIFHTFSNNENIVRFIKNNVFMKECYQLSYCDYENIECYENYKKPQNVNVLEEFLNNENVNIDDYVQNTQDFEKDYTDELIFNNFCYFSYFYNSSNKVEPFMFDQDQTQYLLEFEENS